MYKGVRYRVTCQELNAPLHTLEGSYQLANKWWERKLAEINKPTAEEELRTRYQRQDLEEKIMAGDAARRLLTGLHPPQQLHGKPIQEDIRPAIETNYPPEIRERILFQAADTLGGIAPQDRRTAHQMDTFLELQRLRKHLKGTSYNNLRYFLFSLKEVLPDTIDTIDKETVKKVYKWLRSGTKEDSSQDRIFGVFRRFVEHLYQSEAIDALPRNLYSSDFSFESSLKKIKTYDPAFVRQFMDTLTERLKLYFLLGLNCGMYGVDMATLRQEEYRNGRITRKRTKTEKVKDVPTVCYLLWDETRELLDKHRSNDPEWVLVSKTGTRLWKMTWNDKLKRYSRTDIIAAQWRRNGHDTPAKRAIPLKAVRSIGSTKLDEKYPPSISTLYLGQSPKSIKDKHYAAPPQALFDEAILWLHDQLFVK